MRSRPSGAPLVAAAGAMIGTALFLLPWWNRYLGLTLDGYFPLYGHLILSGRVPYRDFFLHLPPLQALCEAALESLVGRSLFAVRLAGALGRVALAGVVAAWLGRRYRAGAAIFAALAAVWLASGDDTEILDLYNHHALLAALLAGWAAAAALDAPGTRRERWLLFASGGAAALAFWTKQTVGLAATLAIPGILVLVVLRDGTARRGLLPRLGAYASGWMLPSALLAGWLASANAFRPFVEQVFRAGAASKGSPGQLLLRPWLEPFQIPILTGAAIVGLGTALLSLLVTGPLTTHCDGDANRAGAPRRSWLILAGTAAAVFLVLVAGHAIAARAMESVKDLRTVQRFGIFLGYYGLMLPGLLLGVRALRRSLTGEERQRLLEIGLALALGASLALSWPGSEVMALPSLAVFLAPVLEARGGHPARRALRALVVASAIAVGVSVFALRLLVPFAFGLWTEPPVAHATYRPTDPTLRGLRLSPITGEAVEGTLAIIRRVTRPGEPIFTFSAIPIFHWLADRPLATFAALHWIDVTPDAVTRADIPRLEATLPPVILRQHIQASILKLNEGYFRGKVGTSGLRDLDVALVELLTAHYRLEAEYPQYLGYASHLEVWVRNDR